MDEGMVFNALAESMVLRSELASHFGMSFSGKRDLWKALGYPKTLTYQDLDAKYRRGGYGRAAVNRVVRSCWKLQPAITDESAGTNDTPFEKAWGELAKKRTIYRAFAAVDKLCRIGNYAVLLIGLDDSQPLDKPAESASQVTFLRAYSQANAAVATFDNDQTSPRYGQPTAYNLQTVARSGEGSGIGARSVHWTRVIHVAEDADEDPVYGDSTIEMIFNVLMNLELISGGSAEMFWRGGFPGLAFLLDRAAKVGKTDRDAMKEEIEEYEHGFRRTLNLRGITPQMLAPAVADPSAHIAVQVDELCAAIECPKRIYLGSERGDLASSADEKNWRSVVRYRQENHCEPVILRQFADRVVLLGVIPEPTDNTFEVAWPDQGALDPKDAAEVGRLKAESMRLYRGTPGMDTLMPEEMFLELIVGIEPEQIAKLQGFYKEMEAFAGKGSDDPNAEDAGGVGSGTDEKQNDEGGFPNA